MVKCYRSIWNEALGAWVAAPEIASAKGKSSGKRVLSTLAAAIMLGCSPAAMADDCSDTVSEHKTGSCLIAANKKMTITQTGSLSAGYIGFGDGGPTTLTVQKGGSYLSDADHHYADGHIKSWMPIFSSSATLNNEGLIAHTGDEPMNGFENAFTNNGHYAINNSGVMKDVASNQLRGDAMVRITGNGNTVVVNNSGTMLDDGAHVYTENVGSGNVGTITNSGTMTSHADSAIEVTGSNSISIRNSGVIETGVANGVAISLGNANDSLTLESSAKIIGSVNAGGGSDTLALAGGKAGSFDIAQIGADKQYRNFDVFQKNEAATWTLTGDNSASQAQNWQLRQGGLQLTGKLTGGVTQTRDAGVVDLQVNGGSISADPNDKSHSAIAMNGDADATVSLDSSKGDVGINGAIVASSAGNKSLTLTGTQNGTLRQDGSGVTGFDHYVKSGSGNWTLSGANHGDAAWDLRAGSLTVDNDLSLGSGQLKLNGGTLALQGNLKLANAIAVDADSRLNLLSGQQGTLSGSLSGAAALNKSGAGTLILNGDSSGYRGATTVSEGGLVVNGKLASSGTTVGRNGALSVNGKLVSARVAVDGILQGNGSIDGNVAIGNGGTLAPGSHGVLGKLTVNGNLDMASGARLDYDIGTPGATLTRPGQSDALQVNGDVKLGGTLNVANSGGGIGYYRVLDYSGGLSGSLAVSGVPAGYTPRAFAVDTSQNHQVNLVVGGGDASMHYWNGSTTSPDDKVHGGNGSWDATSSNWTNQNGSLSAVSAQNGHMVFMGQAGAVEVKGGHSFDSLQFVTDGYTLKGDGALNLRSNLGNEVRVLGGSTRIDTLIDGDGMLNKTGDGTLVLGGNNRYSGGTTLRQGTIKVASDSNLGAGGGALNFAGGTLETSADMRSARAVHLNQGGGALNVDKGSTLRLDGTLDGAGALLKKGDGTLVLSGNNRYSGGTLLAAGVTEISAAANLGSGALALAGGTLHSKANVELKQAVLLNQAGKSPAKQSLSAGSAASPAAVGGGRFDVDSGTALRLAGEVSGAGQLSKSGAGTLVLAGHNSYAGGTQFDGGTIRLEDNRATGSGAISVNGAGGTLDFANDMMVLGNDIVLNSNLITNISPASSSAVIFGAISGKGGLSKTGAGVLALVDDNTYSGATQVKAGTLAMNGSAVNSAFSVDKGAALSGGGSVGALDVHGTLSPGRGLEPGSETSTLNVVHDLTLQQDARYVATIGADGKSDLVQVGGRAEIKGAALDVQAQSGEYRLRSRYTILSAGGGLTGQFGTTRSNLPFLTPTASYDANHAYLTMTRNDVGFDAFGLNQNQRHAGRGLAEMQKKLGSNALLDAVAALTVADIPAAYWQLSAESYASLQNAAERNNDTFMSSVWGQMGVAAPQGEQGKDTHVWVSLPMAQQSVKGSFETSAYKDQTWGVSLGADTEVAPNLRVGVAGGYLSSTQKDGTLGSKGTVNSGSLSVYSQYDNGNWWLGGMAGLGVGRLSNHRTVSFPGYSATADGGAPVASAFARLGGGYRIQTAVGTIEPLVSVDVSSTRMGDLTESGDSDIKLKVHGSTQTAVASEVGARFSRDLALDSGKLVALSASLSWRHQLLTPANTVDASFVTGDTAMLSYRGWQPQKDSAVLGLGAKVSVSKSSDLSLGYQGQFGGGQTSNALTGTYQYHW